MDNDYFSNGGIPLNSISADTIMNTHWDDSADQYSQFNSMVSSPVSSNSNNCDIFGELIGKLGTFCTSPEPPFTAAGSVHTCYVQNHDSRCNNNSDSARASCYNTPLNSPSNYENLVPFSSPPFPVVSAHPGFPHSAAKFSCFGGPSFNDQTGQYGLNNRIRNVPMRRVKWPTVMSSHYVQNNQPQEQMMCARSNLCPKANSNDDFSVSELVTGSEPSNVVNTSSTRKRKAVSRGKRRALGPNLVGNVAEVEDCTREKRSKPVEVNGNKNGAVKMEEQKGNAVEKKEKEKIVEPQKDYIHVRARRGQATDSHSLAERVRREKISRRMKLLQDLVPGCNKVTGKAVMLDEIINYVQSLQHQVEFLSMKLATVKPSMKLHINNHLPKDICQPNSSFPQHVFPLHGFGENPTQLPVICEDDLQSIVQMGFSKD